MNYREFGSTGMKVSEAGFGAWGIGGKSWGAVDPRESRHALARSEELGCNFVDTAEVYGDSELILGEFLRGRRDRWFIATKYSGQPEGILRTAERQLERLKVETIDFYQLHWAPTGKDAHLYEDLYRLKQSGKARAVGVSVHNVEDIDYVLRYPFIDALQMRFSLVDPDPYLARLNRIRERKIGICVRSSLKSGFLTGKYSRDVSFPDPNDHRSTWSRREIIRTVETVENFRFLESEAGSMTIAAARYPLGFPETSTVLLGTKTPAHAEMNFGKVPEGVLSVQMMAEVQRLQKQLGLRSNRFAAPLLRLLKAYGYKLFDNVAIRRFRDLGERG
jgi:aryl-alcohol dehydrogenase-like predicted oxidoreductase